MIALIVIAAILLLILLLLLAPVRLEIAFEQNFTLKVKYLFLSFPISFDEEEKPEEPKEEPEEEPKKEGKSMADRLKAMFKREGVSGLLHTLYDAVKLVTTSTKRLISHIKLKKFDLYLCVAGANDAAEAAIYYGQVSTGVYGACGVLFSLMPCKKKAVTVDLNYDSYQDTASFNGKISLRPIFVLREAGALLKGGWPILKKFR